MDIDKAALKAVKETNLCTKHMKYHGQQTKDCTPEERILVKINPPSIGTNKLEGEV